MVAGAGATSQDGSRQGYDQSHRLLPDPSLTLAYRTLALCLSAANLGGPRTNSIVSMTSKVLGGYEASSLALCVSANFEGIL